ncbi:MAG: S41 family peptidase [Oscillospiraceae bacterium]|nr:S41 family peptidase [Oscillospiraceae bacterium]
MVKNKNIVILGVVVILFTNVFSFIFGGFFIKDKLEGSTAQNNGEYSKLDQVKRDLEYMYDGNVDEAKLMDGAIKGMADSLGDPYTVYMDSQEYSDFVVQSTGKYSGIGIQIIAKKDINKIEVVDVFKDSPAEKAGIKVQDYIVKVDNEEVDASSSDRAVTLMKGKEGSSVTVTIYREGIGNIDVSMVRSVVTVNTVTGEMIDDKIGYIKISMFDENTSGNLKAKLKELSDQNMKGLILDLRDNPGGLLDQCVSMVSNFVKNGDLIVSTKGKNSPEKKFISKGGDYVGLPMVILMNGNSASASEIFIGAMRDYKLATTVGTKSFGKGIVQSLHPYPQYNSALKVTTSKYYTPLGNNIQGTGIQPDIKVEYPSELLKQAYSRDNDPQFQKALEVIKTKI